MTAPLLVVMGVSGSGKSTVGAAVAQRLGVPFADADDFHPAGNIAKMTAGEALDDEDRGPWLEAIGQWYENFEQVEDELFRVARAARHRGLDLGECLEELFLVFQARTGRIAETVTLAAIP